MIRHVLRKLVEAMQRPGLLGAFGIRRATACQRDLAAYFRLVLSKLPLEDLSRLAVSENKETAMHAAEMTITRVLRMCRPQLLQTLATHMMLAYKEGYKHAQVHDFVKEADDLLPSGSPIDIIGPTGERAADFAATSAGDLIRALDEQTLELLREAVAQAIEEKLGVDGLARLIRKTVMDMSVDRAKMIATTEMNNAISTATLEKLANMNVQYKRWIAVDDPCDICSENEADGAIPVDETFSSGDDAPPAHPNCRCAVVGARPPKEDS